MRHRRLVCVLAGQTAATGTVNDSPDGKLLVSTSFDGTARVWDTASGRVLRIFPHTGEGFFSPDGRLIAGIDPQGIVRFWNGCADCTNGNALLTIAKTRVTRQLTPVERATYAVGE